MSSTRHPLFLTPQRADRYAHHFAAAEGAYHAAQIHLEADASSSVAARWYATAAFHRAEANAVVLEDLNDREVRRHLAAADRHGVEPYAFFEPTIGG